MNKTLNPSSYYACFPTPKYGNLRPRNSVEAVRDVIIYNVYRTQNLSPTSYENQPHDGCLSLKNHDIFSIVSASLSDACANHVLLGDFNIHHLNWASPRVRPHHAFELLLSLE